MNTNEYLNHLETEEKRSRLLADLEDDPEKKKNEKRKNSRIRKMINRVRRMADGRIETADKRSVMNGETPEKPKTTI